MKECKYCRSMYEDSLSTCPHCGGNKVVTSEERAEEEALKRKEKENRENAIAAPLKMRNNILMGVGVVVAIVVLIVIIASVNANKPYSDGTTKDEATNLLETGMNYYNSGDFEAAIEYFSQLPSDSKEYEEAQSMIEKSAESYRNSILSKVDTYVQDEEYDVAIGMLEKALKVLPNDTEFKNEYNKIKDLYKKKLSDNALSTAKEFVKNNNYENAIKTLQDAITKIGSDEEVSAQLDVYINSYASSVIDAAKKQYKEYNAPSIYAAENIIEKALNIAPDNQALIDEYNFYKEHEPIKIIAMDNSKKGYSSGDFSTIDSAIDNKGNTHSNVIYINSFAFNAHDGDYKFWWYCYKTIDIDYQYSKITGVLFQNEKYKTASSESQLEFIGYTDENAEGLDNEKILWSGSVSGNSTPLTFSVDVTGRKYIRINFKADIASGSENQTYNCAYVSELYLWK